MNKTTHRMSLKASALALALATLPLGTHAAGLGKITVLSVLGQPLRAEIDVSVSTEEMLSLSARIAKHEAFSQAGIEYSNVLSGVRVSVEKRADGTPYLMLRSEQGINEPFLDLLLEMSWASGRLQREYTFLLDPPDSLKKPASTLPASPVVASPAAPRAAAPKEAVEAVARPAAEKPAGAKDGAEAATHTVKRGETLARIASETLPDGVNLDQMLVALFRGNKDAFDGGNMNRLKTGRILAIPDTAAVAAIDAREARQIVVAQSADFGAYRKKLAAATATAPVPVAAEEPPKQAVSGKITPKVDDKAPAPPAGKDKLEVSKSAVAEPKKSLGARTAAVEEDLIAREKALKEANARIAELDKNLADMKKMLEMKSQAMADAQKQAQAAKPAPAAATPPAPVATPAPAALKPADKPAEKPSEAPTAKPVEPAPTAAEKPAEVPADKPAATPAPARAEKAAEAKPAAKPAATKIAPPPPPPETSFIDDNPEIVYGAGGVLALLLGYLGFAKWRKKRQESATPDTLGPSSQSEPSINSVFGNTAAGGQIVDTGSTAISSLDTDFSVAGVGGTDTNEGVDPIAEADVYMAYGRNAQAEEILLDALKNDPTRHAIHVKLLEIYAARKSLKQFETIATDLRDQTGGSGDEWDQAIELGKQIDPDNPLYVPGGGVPAAVPAAAPAAAEPEAYNPAATMVMSPQELGRLAEEFGTKSGGQAYVDTAAETSTVAPADDVPESLDFELDLDSGDHAPASDEAIDLGDEPASPVAAKEDDDFAIDFDLGSEPRMPESAAPAQSGAPAPAAGESSVMDFKLDEPAATTGELDAGLSLDATDTPAAPAATDADAGMNFDLGEAPATAAAGTTPSLAASGIDLSSISLELETPPLSAAPELSLEAPAPDDVPLDIPPLSPAAAALAASAPPAAAPAAGGAGSPEVDTKLELASAYEEMGDKEGARELLQEVLNEGNEAQKAIARGKLDQLA